MKPPKCRFCGAEEWRHVCRRESKAPLLAETIQKTTSKKSTKKGKKK